MSDTLGMALTILLYAAIGGGALYLYLRFKIAEYRARLNAGREIAYRQEQHQARTEAQALVRLWRDLTGYFPFLASGDRIQPTADTIHDALASLLRNRSSIGICTEWGIPAPSPSSLSLEERRRHLAIFGKTGSGKSTLLEHLIAEDMEAGRGVVVVSPEGEFFRNRLLSLVPAARHDDVIYVAPGDPENTVTFNPLSIEEGEDCIRAGEDLFLIFKRILGEDIGTRTQPILQNAFALLVGREGATLHDINRLFVDMSFRTTVLQSADPYIKDFWTTTYPRFPKGADLPIIHRLDRFLRPRALRRTLLAPRSSFSIRTALQKHSILFVDLFGLSESEQLALGQMILSKLQLELLRREVHHIDTDTCFLYADEFPRFGGTAPDMWRALFSRGRKYGLALTVASQYPAQLPSMVQKEVFGNVGSLISFVLSDSDARVVRRELLHSVEKHGERSMVPIPESNLLRLRVGEAYMKYGNGLAFKVSVMPPRMSEHDAQEVIKTSRERYNGSHIHDAAVPDKPIDEAVEIRENLPDVTQPVAPAGRGGAEHTYLQSLIKQYGEDRGFKATIEKALPGGGRVDVALERDDVTVACEISISTSGEHELGNISKCLEARFDHVLVISQRKRLLERLKKRVRTIYTPEEYARIVLASPQEMLAFLDDMQITAPSDEARIAGYKVRVTYKKGEEKGSAARLSRVILSSLESLQRTKQ